MKKIIDSQLQREADHRSIIGSASFLSKIFTTIFPSSLDFDKSTLRLKVFSKIISQGIIDLNNKRLIGSIEEFSKIRARSTKKKILDSLSNTGLIEKGSDGLFRKTNVGEAAWQSIVNFLETYKPIEEEVIAQGGRVYEYSFVEITIDEKGNCCTTANFGLINLGKERIHKMEHSASSVKTPYKGIFTIQHSKNIEKYELTTDDELTKKFNIFFKEPIKRGQYVEFWYKYNWHNKFPLTDISWQYNYYAKTSMAKEFMLKLNLPKDYKINEDTLQKYTEGESLRKDSIPFDPVIIDQGNSQTLLWRIKNIHPRRKYVLNWKKE